tara:strand:+ start:404 stop:556 length:153 start_codon:yes stop_codon:yes gene_type:complete
MEKRSVAKLTHPHRPNLKRWGKIANFIEENTGLMCFRLFLGKIQQRNTSD